METGKDHKLCKKNGVLRPNIGIMRKQKLIKSTIAVIIKYVVFMIIGLITPRLIIQYYGSAVNGLVNSITQFLGYISLLDMGLNAVVASSLYAPLAKKDDDEVSRIVVSCDRFYKKVALALLAYSIIVMFVYPFVINDEFDFWYIAGLVFAIALNSFSQYFFGVTWMILLEADQRIYTKHYIETFVALISLLCSVILIKKGFSIQMVKLAASIVFILKPLFLSVYVKRNYNINKKIRLDGEPIKQKKNGIAHHLAYAVFSGTDVTILTLFSSLESVSVYSVYFLAVNAVSELLRTVSYSVTSLIGNMLSREEFARLKEFFKCYVLGMHFISVAAFSTAAVSIRSFVHIYTKGVNDANYDAPVFALVLIIAYAVYTVRIPYKQLINAAGHYKQTQKSAIIEVVINLAASVILVLKFDIIGVAIGTLLAMLYRTVYYVKYVSKNIIFVEPAHFFKICFTDFVSIAVILIETRFMTFQADNFVEWAIGAVFFGVIYAVTVLIVNVIFNKKELIAGCRMILNKNA